MEKCFNSKDDSLIELFTRHAIPAWTLGKPSQYKMGGELCGGGHPFIYSFIDSFALLCMPKISTFVHL
jgi:hypothetical protein